MLFDRTQIFGTFHRLPHSRRPMMPPFLPTPHPPPEGGSKNADRVFRGGANPNRNCASAVRAIDEVDPAEIPAPKSLRSRSEISTLKGRVVSSFRSSTGSDH